MSVQFRVCPHCGARNRADDEWCGQCHTRFDEPEADMPAAVGEVARQEADNGAVPTAEPGSGAAETTEPTPAVSGPTWNCTVCGTENPVAESVCTACGTTIFAAFGAEDSTRSVEPAAAARWGVAIPGGGHWALGQSLHGAALASLTVLAVLLGVLLTAVADRRAVGLLLVAAGVAVWLIGALDAYNLARGRPDETVLRPRVITVLAAAVVVVALFALTLSGPTTAT